MTLATGKIDFRYHALPDESSWTLFNDADEFVPRNALKTHITLKNLQICGADAGQMDPYERRLCTGLWGWIILLNVETLPVPMDCPHHPLLVRGGNPAG